MLQYACSILFGSERQKANTALSCFWMDGDVRGSDTISCCTGTYVQDGDKFAATVAVRRHTQGPASVFGVDNVDLTLSGKSTPTMASCIGTADQVPSTTLQATLIRIAD